MSSNAGTSTGASLSPGGEKTDNPGGFRHIPALDGVRGLAILLVLFCHLFWSNSHTGNRLFDFISALWISSYVGVNLFFALSGFLITGILLDTLEIPHYFKTFYARRVLRIFPLYYGVLLLALLLTRPLHFVWNGWQYFYLTYIANLVFWTRPPLIMQHFNIDHFWSLQVEEQFYLIWPLVIYRVRNLHTLIRVSLIACVAILAIRIGLAVAHPADFYLIFSATFSCADNLLFGCCLCFLLRTTVREKVLAWAPKAFALCLFILIFAGVQHGSLYWYQNGFFIPTVGFSLIGIASATLVAMALRRGSRAEHLFTNGTLRFFGKYSYGIYVFHYPIQGALSAPIRVFVDTRFHSKLMGVLSSAAIIFLASILIALLSYHFYESRFLKLKKYFSYNRSRTKMREPAELQS